MEKSMKEIYEKLRAPFDLKCYSVDSSRGFDLTSLKAHYISIRLNEVVGLDGWEFSGHFEEMGEEFVFHGRLKIEVGDQVVIREGVGSCKKTPKKSAGDVLKSARTDSLSKTASLVGIAEDAFCGLINPKDVKSASGKLKQQQVTKAPAKPAPKVSQPEPADLPEPNKPADSPAEPTRRRRRG